MRNDLTIIVPIYNEEAVLPKILPELTFFCLQNKFKLLLVNDGSKDNSLKVIRQHVTDENGDVSVINHKLNRGYGGALKSGVMASNTEYSIFIDADGQHRLEDVSKLYDKIQKTDADMIVGSRKGQRGNWFREIGKSLIRRVARFLMEVPVYDINSGMKIFRTELGKKYLHLYPDSMSFSDIICLVFINSRHLVLEEPIVVLPRKGGKSTIGIRTAFQTVMEILNIVVLFNPLKVFLPLSFVLFTIGLFQGIKYFIANRGISVGSSFMLMISMFIFLLGLITEQLSNIRRHGRS